MNLLKSICNHSYQTIHTNGFEQGQVYITGHRPGQNRYITVTPSAQIESNSLFELICTIWENGMVYDFPKYKANFIDSISVDLLKNITKQHCVLKRDLYDFVYQKGFSSPDNPNIFKLFSNILQTNIVVLDKKEFTSYDVSFNRTVVFCENWYKVFDTYDTCVEYLVQFRNAFEKKDFSNMKVNEIKEYAQFYKIDITNLKKKQNMIDKILEYKN